MLSLVGRVLSGSRYAIVIAVIGTLLASVVLLAYGTLVVAKLTWDLVRDREVNSSYAKSLSIEFLQLVDLFLVGTVLYIIAIGLYELFIDDQLETPGWLHIETLDDLKNKLISVIVALLAVTFANSAVGGKGGQDIFYYGIAIAAVLVPLIALQFAASRSKAKRDVERSASTSVSDSV